MSKMQSNSTEGIGMHVSRYSSSCDALCILPSARKKAIRLLTSYVDLKPHAFDLKTRIILDHFMAVTMKTIEGKGLAMLVTKSRLHAVRFQLAFQKVLGEIGLPFKYSQER